MISWNRIQKEIGLGNLIRFAYGKMTKRQLGTLGTYTRFVCDQTPITELRTRARSAVKRRSSKEQRFAVLNAKLV